jgi:hypothetical protein
MPLKRSSSRHVFWPRTQRCADLFPGKIGFTVVGMGDDRCEVCGANIALVGRRHRCVPNNVPNVPNSVSNKIKVGDSRHRGPLKNSIAANIAKLPELLPIHVDR